jgi:NAD(P)H-hydrate epimerase
LIPVLTADEMRSIDQETIRHHVDGLTLMEHAGKGVTEEMLEALRPRKTSTIVIVCGKGNNGGDGFVVARHLKKRGYRVKVHLVGKPAEVKGDALVNLKRCRKLGIRINQLDKAVTDRLEGDLDKANIIVDAIFGTGFEGSPRGLAREVIDLINLSGAPKVAIDIPSGVNSSTGEANLAIGADLTVTMALPKRGHMLYPGKALTGNLVACDIGVPPEVVYDFEPDTFLLEADDIRAGLPLRPPDAHKWTCGHVAVIAGSTGYTGAAALSCVSALRSGCGLVTLAVPRSLNPVMEVKLTEVMTQPFEETPDGSLAYGARSGLLDFIERADAVAIGPGLSRHGDTFKLVRSLMRRIGRPCVLDADGINAFEGHASKLKSLGYPLVITPHAGEASRLMGIEKEKIAAQPVEFARRVASNLELVVVLKGAPTVVASPDGRVFINPTGNPGLATAGSGDVLTGIVAGLLAQGVHAVEAACMGVFIHGLLGDMLLEETGYVGFIAGDLAETIPEAMASLVREGGE